ncbi:MAG: ABC transporter ATP-binding protein [Oligoflexia bacterium]|nr:ABC transporter ATP-binding protein [Oligoflexia bacterium]
MESIVKISNVSKFYGGFCALKNVNLELKPNRILALVGPNGAGKTSLLKSILGLASFKEGSITVNGISSPAPESRKSLAYLPEKFFFYDYYTVKGTIAFYGQMYGLSGSELNSKISTITAELGIDSLLEKKLSTLSKGQLQRTGIASVLISDADTIFLDEPFSGLDPVAIKELKDILLNYKSKNKTIFINSHILGEIEKFCDEYAIMNHGEIIETGEFSNFKDGSFEDYFYKKVKNNA